MGAVPHAVMVAQLFSNTMAAEQVPNEAMPDTTAEMPLFHAALLKLLPTQCKTPIPPPPFTSQRLTWQPAVMHTLLCTE